MRSRVAAGIAGAAVVVAMATWARRRGRSIDWAAKIEAMPDDAPPKWVFTTLRAIRENTEKILAALDAQTPTSRPPAAPPGP